MKEKKINGKTYPVGESYLKPKLNTCYKYKDGKYYVYRGKFDPETSKKQGLYNKNGKIYLHKVNEEDLIINDILSNSGVIKENIKESEINNTSTKRQEIFAPAINDEDGILIRVIKKKLKERQFTIRQLQLRFDSLSQFNNFKRALIIRNDITFEGFTKWMDVLGFEWSFNFKDKEK